jgi:hypothetical protein
LIRARREGSILAEHELEADRSLAWTGDMVDSIVDNNNPGTTPPFSFGAQSQSFAYTPARRLASAKGYYGQYSWTYEGSATA